MEVKKIELVVLITLVVSSVVFAEPLVHVLSSGETLYSLSLRYDVSLDELLERNNISDPSSLSVGTRLTIPSNGSSLPEVARAVTGQGRYTVESGDTYYSISRRHNMTVNELLSLNSRTVDDTLRPGDSLVVVVLPSVEATSPPPEDPAPPRTGTRVESPWWPVSGEKSPLSGKLEGVSIAATPSSYVQAIATGEVVWTGPYRGFGQVVLIDSGGYIYLYGGNSDLFVNVGQSVAAGSRIGRLNSAGPMGGTQDMIFSVFKDGAPIAPDNAPRG